MIKFLISFEISERYKICPLNHKIELRERRKKAWQKAKIINKISFSIALISLLSKLENFLNILTSFLQLDFLIFNRIQFAPRTTRHHSQL